MTSPGWWAAKQKGHISQGEYRLRWIYLSWNHLDHSDPPPPRELISFSFSSYFALISRDWTGTRVLGLGYRIIFLSSHGDRNRWGNKHDSAFRLFLDFDRFQSRRKLFFFEEEKAWAFTPSEPGKIKRGEKGGKPGFVIYGFYFTVY